MVEVYLLNGVPYIEGPYGLERMSDYEYREALEHYAVTIKSEYQYD